MRRREQCLNIECDIYRPADTEFTYRTLDGALNVFDVETLKAREIVSATLMVSTKVEPNRRKLMIISVLFYR